MRSFTDTAGKQWTIELSLLHARKIEAADWSVFGVERQVKIMDQAAIDQDFFASFMSDTGKLAFLGYLMLTEEASQDEFLAHLSGKAIEDMREAVWAEILDFFPMHRIALSRVRDLYRKAVETMNKMATKEMDAIDMDKLEGELEQILSRMIGPGQTST